MSLEVPLTFEVGRRREKDLFDLLGPADELLADRQEGCDGSRNVRRRHARAAVLEILGVVVAGLQGVALRAGRAGDDLLPGSDEVRLPPAVPLDEKYETP